MLDPQPVASVAEDTPSPSWRTKAAQGAAARSVDWWRQVGAALRFARRHGGGSDQRPLPHDGAARAAGDPRSNFTQGVELELSTATHAEAALIAQAARDGRATAGATIYVTATSPARRARS